MGKKSSRLRNPVVYDALMWHASKLGLEVLEYKHVTLPRLEIAFLAMHQLDDKMTLTGDRAGVSMDLRSGVYIAARRVSVPSS